MQLLQQEMSMIYTTSSHNTVYFASYWQDTIRKGRGLLLSSFVYLCKSFPDDGRTGWNM